MRGIRIALFTIFLLITIGLHASQYSPPVSVSISNSVQADLAVQNQRLNDLEKRSDAQAVDIRALMTEMAAQRSAMERFTGIGIGIGSVLCTMEGIMIILTYKRKKE